MSIPIFKEPHIFGYISKSPEFFCAFFRAAAFFGICVKICTCMRRFFGNEIKNLLMFVFKLYLCYNTNKS